MRLFRRCLRPPSPVTYPPLSSNRIPTRNNVHSKSGHLDALIERVVLIMTQASYDPRRVFRFSLPDIQVGPKTRAIGTYLSGGLVSPHCRSPLSCHASCLGMALISMHHRAKAGQSRTMLMPSSPCPSSSYSTPQPFPNMPNLPQMHRTSPSRSTSALSTGSQLYVLPVSS